MIFDWLFKSKPTESKYDCKDELKDKIEKLQKVCDKYKIAAQSVEK